MPRRELLSPAQRQSLLAIPIDRADLMEHYILSEQDLALIRQRRGADNRIGTAVQLAFLRFPGRALQPDETPRQASPSILHIAGLGNHQRIRPCCLLPCSLMQSIWG